MSEFTMPLDVLRALQAVRRRPGMYIGRVTLENLRAYLAGYCMAMDDSGIPEPCKIVFEDFHAWVARYFDVRVRPYGWGNLILAKSRGDNPEEVSWESYEQGISDSEHAQSVRLFYDLFDKFLIARQDASAA